MKMIRLRDAFNGVMTFIIRRMHKPLRWDDRCGYITVFHDYEGAYSSPSRKEPSYRGVTQLLEIEKKHNVKASYNIVGKLFDDCPEIIERIISEGHDIASHSYNHKVITKFSLKQIDEDMKKSKEQFDKYNVAFNGFRSPQSRWCFGLIRSMQANGLKWSAERDRSDYPYIIHKKGKDSIIRFPIKMDDWDYISDNVSSDTMFKKLIGVVKEIRKKRSYGAIGFHPWVQGETSERLDMFETFLKEIISMDNLKIKSFGEMYNSIIKI